MVIIELTINESYMNYSLTVYNHNNVDNIGSIFRLMIMTCMETIEPPNSLKTAIQYYYRNLDSYVTINMNCFYLKPLFCNDFTIS